MGSSVNLELENLVNGTTAIIGLVAYIILVVAMWKMFTKAGEAGWKSIIPILNLYVLFKISWGNGWLFLLLIIPIVGGIFHIIMNWKTAKAYGYGAGMGIVAILFTGIAYLVIGFGNHEYIGPQ